MIGFSANGGLLVQPRQRLLVSIRGPVEALAAARGGAQIADVEYPASALGTPYPFNIALTRSRLNSARFRGVAVSTNIGEVQDVRASACQAALGVAVSGADLIKFGLAGQAPEAANYLASKIVQTVHAYSPKPKRLFPAVFVDDDMARFFKPLRHGIALVRESKADGLLVDTFNKLIGKGLLDYWTIGDVSRFVSQMHSLRKEAWIAGSITLEQMPILWRAGVDVICVRGAACGSGSATSRFAPVTASRVRELVATIPPRRR